MNIIDLSLELYTDMPVFSGDPEASIEVIQTIEEDNWEMRRLQINSHDSTHVNVPAHCVAGGKNLDEYTPADFIGEAVKFETLDDIQPEHGVIFDRDQLTQEVADRVLAVRPRFVGLGGPFQTDTELQHERDFLAAGIITFEKLVNTEKLPQEFVFHGAPLRIRAGDGSPVRAFAVVK